MVLGRVRPAEVQRRAAEVMADAARRERAVLRDGADGVVVACAVPASLRTGEVRDAAAASPRSCLVAAQAVPL